MPDALTTKVDLFHEGDLSELLRSQHRAMLSEIDEVAESDLLNADERAWAKELGERYQVRVPTLLDGERYVEEVGEVTIETLDGKQRPGKSVLLHFPFDGDVLIFTKQPSVWEPCAFGVHIWNDALVLPAEFVSGEKPEFASTITALTKYVEQHLDRARADVEDHNKFRASLALHAINDRKARLLADQKNLAEVGIPVRKRGDAPKTYSAPGIVRREAPERPPRKEGQPARALEPVLEAAFYEHISQLVRSTSRAIERTPERFKAWDEEALRDLYLVMLNSHYEGAAVGEAFQAKGKTDILVRQDDRNVFVGECKWWSGKAAFTGAIDQLFSYTTWRDTKLALVVFVKTKELTPTMTKGKDALGSHPQFIAWEPGSGEETELRAEMTWPGDAARRATLSVFFVHVV